jgi:hypothetical protein
MNTDSHFERMASNVTELRLTAQADHKQSKIKLKQMT